MLIKDIMTPNPITCCDTDSLNDAAQRMWEQDVGAIPVVDESGMATGMLTDRDIAMAAYIQGRPPASIPVQTAMAKMLHTVRPDEDVRAAHQAMREHQVRRLPVVDAEGKPVGIIALNDIARRLGTGRSAIPADDIAQTLRDLCRPRGTETPALAATG